MAEAAQDSGCFCRKSSKIGNDPHRVKWCVLNNMTADIKHKETLPAWERFAVQWIRLIWRGGCDRKTVTCVPSRIGRWVFANSTRSVAATILWRLFWYKVSVFLYAPGDFKKLPVYGLFYTSFIRLLFRRFSKACTFVRILCSFLISRWFSQSNRVRDGLSCERWVIVCEKNRYWKPDCLMVK